MSETVRYVAAEGVATLTLNRPESMNSLDTETKEALLAALRRAGDDDSVRAVVLTGAGRSFCAGQDLRAHAETLEAGREGVDHTVREHYNPITTAIATMPKPVIAAVNGMAAGAGAGFAFACDLRVAAADAGFLLAFARVGLGADSGASWTLQRLVGYGRAAELLLLAEPISADRAYDIGLVNRVVPTEEVAATARELAVRLAAGPTAAYAAIKSALGYAAGHDLPAALENEEHLQGVVGATADHREATEAFLAKRTPHFTGR